jgi:serine/arginine repetitive matrix protein 2
MSNTSSRASKQHFRSQPSSSSAPRQPMQYHGSLYATDTLSPTAMNATGSSPLHRRDNRDKDSNRSHSMTHSIQPPPYALSSNRSLTNLRPQPGFRSSNPYNYPNPTGGGLRPPGSYPRSFQPALSSDSRLPPQGSQGYEDQRLSYAGQAQEYSNSVYTNHRYAQQHAGQGHENRSYGNRQNQGQTMTKNPSSRSTMSLEGPPVEDDDFPVYREANYPDQFRQEQNVPSGHPMPRKMTGNFTREPRSEDRRERRRRLEYEPRSDTTPLPADHKQRIAAEQARLKRSAPASMSSFNTNLRAESDPPSSDMALPPTPKDGSSMEVHRSLDRTKVIKAANVDRLVITEEHSSVPYYETNGQLELIESAEPGTQAIPVGFIDRTTNTVEQMRPARATLTSDPFLGQEARPMSMEVVSPQLNNIVPITVSTCASDIAELPASPVAPRITRNLILRGLEASTTGDIQSLTESMTSSGPSPSLPSKLLSPSKKSLIPRSTTPQSLTPKALMSSPPTPKSLTPRPLTPGSLTLSKMSEAAHASDLPAEQYSASDMSRGAALLSTDCRDNRHSILSQTGSSVFDSSTLEFAVQHSIPTAKGGGFRNEPGVEGHVTTSASINPGNTTEDGMSDVLAGYQGTDSKNETNALVRSGTANESKSEEKEEEHTDASTDHDMKPLPLVFRPRSSHAQKSSDELSFKSCTDLSDVSSESMLSQPGQDLARDLSSSAIDIAPQRDASSKGADVHPFATAVHPVRAVLVPQSRLPSSSLGTMAMSQGRTTVEMALSKPSPAILRKQPPVPPRESSFSVVANKLRTSSKQSMKQGSISVSGSSSTLSTTHLGPVVPPRESSTSKEAQRVNAAVSFLMRPLPTRFARSRKYSDQEERPRPDETVRFACGSSKDTGGVTNFNKTASSPPPAMEANKTPQAPSTKPKGVPVAKTRVISFDTPEACNPSKVLGSIPALVSQPIGSPVPAVLEPSSVYSSQDTSSGSHVDSADGVSVAQEPSHRDSQTTTHLDWHRYAPSPHSGGAQQVSLRPLSGGGSQLNSMALGPLTNIQEDTTTDLRLSGYRYPGPSRYLPDLKEESHEDSSLNTSASNLKSSSFRFPFGAPSGVRASGEDPISFSGRSSVVSHRRSAVGSNVGSALSQAHGLPSMRFSRVNLFDGLTDELGLRYSRSMEEVPNASQRLSRGSPLRPASAGHVTDLRLSLAELTEAGRSGLSLQPTAMMNLFAFHRARSPELMAEIERLTIPSVGGLTQRFSEFFPSLREYYQCGEPAEFPIEEEMEKHALEEIHEIHPTQKRSSARLRPMRGVSHMVVIEDDLYDELTSKEKGMGSPGRPDDGVAVNGASEAASIADKSARDDDATSTPTHTKTAPLPELQVPSPAVLRPRSHTVGPQELRISGESALSSRRSLRSFVSTPTATETRPWNSDKNYPWATSTNPAIDISLPRPAAAKYSPRPGPSHLRNRLSEASTTSSFSTAQTATASPFGSPADSTAHARHHRFSTFGRNGDQPHAVGERYPTSALSPPTAIFRDHLSASDTSDDEHYDTTRKTRLSLRKRFSSTRKATLDSQTNTRASRSKTNAQDLASPESTKQSTTSLLQDRAGEAQAFTSSATANRHTFRDAEGMRAVVYRKQRIIDRLKTWWHKGSRLIRQLSNRRH